LTFPAETFSWDKCFSEQVVSVKTQEKLYPYRQAKLQLLVFGCRLTNGLILIRKHTMCSKIQKKSTESEFQLNVKSSFLL